MFEVPSRAADPNGRSYMHSDAFPPSFIHDLWPLGCGLRGSPRIDRESIRSFALGWMVQDSYPHNSHAIARRGLDRDYQLGQFLASFDGQSTRQYVV
jgi:hypothetical protein